MNNKARNFFNNISYTLSSNLISLVVSSLIVLLVPKLIGIEEYGYWQIYLFYSTYVGFLHFGWCDGIYLRYGGQKYDDLNKTLFFSQFYMFVILQLFIAAILLSIPFFINLNINREFIFQMIAINLIITNIKSMLLFVLQCTNRLKEYAKIIIVEKIFYSILITFFLFLGSREYELMIIADLCGKFLSLLYSIYFCKDIVFKKITFFYFSLNETIKNISTGIKLMFANIASLLIIGVVRFGIERTWDVNTFAKISLTLSLSNFLMIFVNTIGIVMFPILRRTDEKKLPNIYFTIRNVLMVFLLGFLTLYYPIKTILLLWLPQYQESLKYLAILFPMFLFEGKTSLLINTYLKSLRKEKIILKVNMITLSLSIIITFLSIITIKSLDFAVISIVLLLAIRSTLSEVYLNKFLNLKILKNIVIEMIMSIVFIISSWYLNSGSLIIYGIAYLAYLLMNKKNLINSLYNLKVLFKL
ncbi:hypothetical protein ACFSFW_15990 [Fredinandcohnia salidurans]|uniref:Polysaccharide biosynthesis protein n=1 Tax=Fredinandcohnia salidurans TaxID=2595041 RepID=A0ABW4MQC3_9BACI